MPNKNKTARQTIKVDLPNPVPGGLEPVISSVDELDQACEMLAACQSFEQQAAAQRDELVREAGQRYEDVLTVGVTHFDAMSDKDATVDVRHYAATLKAAACDYVRNHRDDVFADDKKTAKRPAADISVRAKAATVGLKANVKKDDVLTPLLSESRLVAAIDKVLTKLGLSRLVRVKVELDLKSIQDDHKSGRLESLPEGLKKIPASETVDIKPASRPIG